MDSSVNACVYGIAYWVPCSFKAEVQVFLSWLTYQACKKISQYLVLFTYNPAPMHFIKMTKLLCTDYFVIKAFKLPLSFTLSVLGEKR